MAIKAILFDLDGTLLPVDTDAFLKTYFGLLAKKMAAHGYDPVLFTKALFAGTDAMIVNDGRCTNETVFWRVFGSFYEEGTMPPIELFDEFYEKDFPGTRAVCNVDARPRAIVDAVKEKGLPCVLATAPGFPAIATETRMGYVDLAPEDFLFYTTFENSSYFKPNEAYYLDIAKRIGVAPEECLMVGNDVTDDMIPARAVGMKTFLLTDYLINKRDDDIREYENGGYDDLLAFIKAL